MLQSIQDQDKRHAFWLRGLAGQPSSLDPRVHGQFQRPLRLWLGPGHHFKQLWAFPGKGTHARNEHKGECRFAGHVCGLCDSCPAFHTCWNKLTTIVDNVSKIVVKPSGSHQGYEGFAWGCLSIEQLQSTMFFRSFDALAGLDNNYWLHYLGCHAAFLCASCLAAVAPAWQGP